MAKKKISKPVRGGLFCHSSHRCRGCFAACESRDCYQCMSLFTLLPPLLPLINSPAPTDLLALTLACPPLRVTTLTSLAHLLLPTGLQMVSHFSGLQTVSAMRKHFGDAVTDHAEVAKAAERLAAVELGSLLSGWRSNLHHD